jgi:hypothetical protein
MVGTLIWVARYGANGRSLTTMPGLRRISAMFFVGQIGCGSGRRENTHENLHLFEPKFCWYGDAKRVCGHRAC